MLARGIKSVISKFAAIVNRSKNAKTSSISRNYLIEVSESGLVSLLGGKWTSFRRMGQDTVDCLIAKNPSLESSLKHLSTQTLNFKFIGSYSRLEAINGYKLNNKVLFDQYEDHLVFAHDLERKTARHLVQTYGTASTRIVDLGRAQSDQKLKGTNQKLHPEYPYLKSEVVYAIRNELAVKPNDILCRRIPIGIIDQKAAESLLNEIVEIQGAELKWSEDKKK